ncbi:MAG: hypothetical protein PUC41_03650 [Oscillospiraceae bacterium]|nr:hypothetical protein [Oscillospiraceae bacterium]
MGFKPEAFCEATELHYEKSNSLFWGNYNGYPICLEYNSQRSFFTFFLCASVSDSEGFAAMLKEWERSQSGISQCRYERNLLQSVIVIPGRNSQEKALASLDALTALAHEHSMVPCCATCGNTSYYAPHMVNESLVLQLCDSCAAKTEESFSQSRAEENAVKINWVGIILGILLGAAALFALTWLLSELGVLHFLSGYIGMVIALFAMKKFGRKVTVPTAILATVICLAVAFITPRFTMAKDLAEFVRDDYAADMRADGYSITELNEYVMTIDQSLETMTDAEISEIFDCTRASLQKDRNTLYEAMVLMKDYTTTKQCFVHLDDLCEMEIMQDVDVKGELLKEILWGMLSVAVGACLTIPGIIRNGKMRYRIRRMV